MTPSPSPAAAAQCTQCGGTLPLRLSGPLTCSYCGAVDPLDAATLALLEPVRRQLAERDRALRQFLDQDHVFSAKFRSKVMSYLPLMGLLWLIVGAMYWGIAGTLLENGPELSQVVSGAVPATSDDARLAWALVYTGMLFFAFTFGLPTLALIRARKAALTARALPPALPGQPPRCRCCMAELPTAGAVRRCEWCGADHVVLDERFRAEQRSLDAAVREALAQARSSLAEDLRKAEKRMTVALTTIVFSVVLGPIVAAILGAVLSPSPGKYWFPALAAAAALGGYLSALRGIGRVTGPEQPRRSAKQKPGPQPAP